MNSTEFYQRLKADLARFAPDVTDPVKAKAAIDALPPVTTRVSRSITKVDMYKTLTFKRGLSVIAALQGMASGADPAAVLMSREILDLIRIDGPGIDIGLDEVRGVVDLLAMQGEIDDATAADLKAMGEVTTDYATATYGVPVHENDCAAALTPKAVTVKPKKDDQGNEWVETVEVGV